MRVWREVRNFAWHSWFSLQRRCETLFLLTSVVQNVGVCMPCSSCLRAKIHFYYRWPFAKKLYHSWIYSMTSSNKISWKLPPPKWRAGCAFAHQYGIASCWDILSSIQQTSVIFLHTRLPQFWASCEASLRICSECTDGHGTVVHQRSLWHHNRTLPRFSHCEFNIIVNVILLSLFPVLFKCSTHRWSKTCDVCLYSISRQWSKEHPA